ncbi:hypothetical protein [Corynebacterium sp.]|uniref:hypothetical protein n=1 Tax=Corynebacterium sp. TaxID=1720 RepID=UPI0026DACCA3|nr:hypothetical protein [Corynebacterium sp.]MDO5032990.1 hypothetical protein [Corynebacterium sp.]
MAPNTLPTALSALLAGRTPTREELIRSAQGVITLATIIGFIVAAVNGVGSSTDEDPEAVPDNCGYDDSAYGLDVDKQLRTVRDDITTALNTWRTEDGLAPLAPWFSQQQEATAKAQCNAVTGTQKPSEDNVQMVQHHLPLEQASGYEFIEAFRSSPEHVAALRDRDMTFAAVGTAYGDGEIYVVIQLERS